MIGVKLIDRALDRYLLKGKGRAKKLYDAMRYSVFSGGKRIRPILTIEASRACGGTVRDALPAACAVELAHTFSLVHDDLPSMDNDNFRRGKPTCHVVFGEAAAILAGDGLLALAFTILAREASGDAGLKKIEVLSSAIGAGGMVAGQEMDIESKGRKKSAALLKETNLLKTARLFEASVKLGALSAGAKGRELRAMAAYGILFGEAFQLADDIADGENYKGSSRVSRETRNLEILIKEAKNALAIFGTKADRLKEIADHVFARMKV